jgi:hypothetical protein
MQSLNFLLERGLAGVPPLSSAAALAAEYRRDRRYRTDDQRVDALINSEAVKNFSTGFLTGLGGAFVLPVAMPAALAASWMLQARLSGAIASLYGHDLQSPRVRNLILRSLAGDVTRDALEDLGVGEGSPSGRGVLARVPGRVMVELNKRVGLRVLTGGWGGRLLGLTRVVPLVGGVFGGTYDAAVCRAVGRAAKTLLEPSRAKAKKPARKRTAAGIRRGKSSARALRRRSG